MTLFDSRYRAIDSIPLRAVDSDGEPTDLTWDEETRVTIDNQPWEDAFGTNTFHKAEYVVTAPAEQPYYVDGEEHTFTKPREELQKAQWRLDNLPWTIEHPRAQRLVDVDEARGFWRGPYYDEDTDQQRAALYIPATDDEALLYAAEHEGVSVGFTHTLVETDEYDGAVGGSVDVDNVDGFQTDIYYDHVATVETPRLPSSGRVAGDALPSNEDGDVMDMSALVNAGEQHVGIAAVDSIGSDARTTQTKRTATEKPRGIFTDSGTWYAIAPTEHNDGDDPKYPLTSCTGEDSIETAWNLRAHGDYTIDQSTLEARIKRAADAMDCDIDFEADATHADNGDTQITMTDIEIDDLTVNTIAEQNDEVASLVDEKEKFEREVDELTEQKDAIEDELENVREELDSFKQTERENQLDEKVGTLTDLTDRWDADELRDMDVDSHDEHMQRLEERIDIYSDITEPSTPEADEAGEDGNGTDDSEYETGEVFDLSNTA